MRNQKVEGLFLLQETLKLKRKRDKGQKTDEEEKKKRKKKKDVFPFVSESVPVSAVVWLAAVEEGVLGVRNLKPAERRIQSESHSQLRPKVRLSAIPSHITQ